MGFQFQALYGLIYNPVIISYHHIPWFTNTSNSDRPAKRCAGTRSSLTLTTQRWPTVGQFRLGCSAVHRSALLKQSHRTAPRTLRSVFKALMASISASVKSNEVQSRLDRSLSLLFVLGMTAIPLCVAQRRRTWAGSVRSLSSSHTLLVYEVRHLCHGP